MTNKTISPILQISHFTSCFDGYNLLNIHNMNDDFLKNNILICLIMTVIYL